MNPVMSDLEIFVRTHEVEIATRAQRRAELLQEAKGPRDGRGWFRRLTDGVHQFVDPRGFALARVRTAEAGTAAEMPTVVTATSVQPRTMAGAPVAASLVELVRDGVATDREEQVAA